MRVTPGREGVALSVQHCDDLAVLLASIRADQPDLVLLNDDGHLREPLFEILTAIKAEADIPCILRSLQADDEETRITALECGCDDWISFGVSERETTARLHAILRRTTRPYSTRQASPARPERAWRLSPERRELYGPDGEALGLTSAEFDLLHTIVQHRGAVVSRDVLSRAVFRRSWYPQDRGIDNLAARLRRKLATRSRNADVVKAVRGVGYAFTGF